MYGRGPTRKWVVTFELNSWAGRDVIYIYHSIKVPRPACLCVLGRGAHQLSGLLPTCWAGQILQELTWDLQELTLINTMRSYPLWQHLDVKLYHGGM